MIDDSGWSETLCGVTDDVKHTLLHVAAMNGLSKYVCYSQSDNVELYENIYFCCVELWKSFSIIKWQSGC